MHNTDNLGQLVLVFNMDECKWQIWFDIYSYEYPPKPNLNLSGCFYRILAQQDMRKETHTNIQIYNQAYVLRDE